MKSEFFKLIQDDSFQEINDKLERLKQQRQSGRPTEDIFQWRDAFGLNLTLCAAKLGRIKIFDLFIQYGADINVVSSDGFNALFIAAENGQTTMLEHLLKFYEMNVYTVMKERTLLHHVAFHDKASMLVYLVQQYNFNISALDARKRSVVHHAAAGGCIKTFDYLQTLNGIDLYALDAQNNNALDIAIMLGQVEMVLHLVRHAWSKKHTTYNITAQHLIFSVIRKCVFQQAKMLQTLVKNKFFNFLQLYNYHHFSDVYSTMSALDLAVEGGKIEMIDLLIAHYNYDVHAANVHERTALSYITKNHRDAQKTAEKLFYYGAGIGADVLPTAANINYQNMLLIGAKGVSSQTHPTAIITVSQFEQFQRLHPSSVKYLLQLLSACFSAYHHQNSEVQELQLTLLQMLRYKCSSLTPEEIAEVLPSFSRLILYYVKCVERIEVSGLASAVDLAGIRLIIEIANALNATSLLMACAIKLATKIEFLSSRSQLKSLAVNEKIAPIIEVFHQYRFWQRAAEILKKQAEMTEKRRCLLS